jgi:hypothetical protein
MALESASRQERMMETVFATAVGIAQALRGSVRPLFCGADTSYDASDRKNAVAACTVQARSD